MHIEHGQILWKKNGWTKWIIALFLSLPLVLFSQTEPDSNLLKQIDLRIEKYEASGPLDSLVYCYKQKIDLLQTADKMADWANTYLDLSLTNPTLTLSYLDTMSASLWRSPRDTLEIEAFLWCFMYQGYYLKEANDVFGSAKAYEKALDYFTDFSPADFDIIEWVFKPLGNHYTRLGENEKAINLFTRAIGLAREKYSSNTLAGLYNNLGLAYWNQAKYTQAIEQYQKGLTLADLNTPNEALLLSNLAGSYFDSGNLGAATEAASRAEKLLKGLIREDTKDRQLWSWISGNKKILGLIQVEEKNYPAANRAFKEALEAGLKASGGTKNRQLGKIYIEQGKLRQLEGKPDEALVSYNQALMAVLPDFLPSTVTDNPNTADLYEENTLFEALEAKASALLGKFNSDSNIQWLKASLECHQLASQAENLLRQTYQYQSSKLRLQGYSRQRSEQAMEVAYQLYFQTQAPRYISIAFEFAEQNKATILLEAIKQNVTVQKIGQGDSLFVAEQQWRTLQADMARQIIEASMSGSPLSVLEPLEAKQREIKANLVLLRQELESKYPALGQMKNQLAPIPLETVQERLGDQESVMIEYFEGKEALFMFRIATGKPAQMIKIPLTDHVKSILNSFRTYFNASQNIANDPAGFLQNAFESFKVLLGQASDIDTGTKLIIIPDGQLNFIPFEALLSKVAPGTNLGQAPYFFKEKTIYYAFSATLWDAHQSRQSAASNSLLAMAPGFLKGERSLSPLEYSNVSTRKLSSAVKGSKRLFGEKASLNNFKTLAPEYRIVHLSTHAYSNEETLPPSIAFMDKDLYLSEIYALRIPADLIVLSACETGLGTYEKGEGIMSLARSFFYAGAGGLVSSLWKVNDQATSSLFLDFYDNLLKKQSIAQALSTAKLDYLNNPDISDAQKSPYYWAGFVYIGQDKVVEVETKNGVLAWWMIVLGLMLLFVGLLYVNKPNKDTI